MASETHSPQHTHTGKLNVHNLVHTAQKDLTPLQGFLAKFNNDWSMMFAGSLAFSLLTAIVPILIAIISILGFFLGSSNTQDLVLNNLAHVLGKSFQSQLPVIQKELNQLHDQALLLAIIAIVSSIFGGSRLFLGLEGCLDIVYRVRPRKVIAQNIMAISMIILFIVLVPIMIFAGALPGIIQSVIANNSVVRQVPFIDFMANNPVTVYLTGFVGGLIAAFLLFWAIYIIVPNQKISLKHSWQGAIAAAVALEVFITIVFPFYAAHFLGNYVGQAGLAIILLVFLYYFAVILMLGAEVNAYFFEKVRPLPNDLATFVSTMAGKLNKDKPQEEGSSHIDPKPTNRADHEHIVEARIPEEENEHKNEQEQHGTAQTSEIAQTKVSQDTMKKQPDQKKRSNSPSKAQTALSVVFGSALALIIELRRQRQH